MSRRLHITLTDDQFDYLNRAAERTSLSVAELVRRAIDAKYPATRTAPSRREFTVAVWRRPAAGGRGRRSGIPLD